ncbi:peptide synthetase, partial [Bacillus cereus]|nr:peptide synthetase [Bacillus cereus]
ITLDLILTHPFIYGVGVYLSGDLVRYLPDGFFLFVGRFVNQVKIRGVRIELGDIEAALQRHILVKVDIVMLQEYYPGDPRLISYVVGDGDAQKRR